MYLGSLGQQVVLISKKAHEEIRYLSSEAAEHTIFYTKRVSRDKKAREEYLHNSSDTLNGLYVIDIIKKGLKHGDKIL